MESVAEITRRAAGAAAILATCATLTGCVTLDACPAIGYVYAGPAVLQFPEPIPESMQVSGCFGEDCPLARLERGNGVRWEMPQAPPYLGGELAQMMGDGSIRDIRVQVIDSHGVVVFDEMHEIPVDVDSTGVFGQCTGPFRFMDVPITSPS